MSNADQFFARLILEEAILVTVQTTRGSVPLEPRAWMAVFKSGMVGTVGGGHLEFEAAAQARSRLLGGAGEAVVRFVLGPSLGQCCGGEVHLGFERVQATDLAALQRRLLPQRTPVALFGGGHVGHALVQVMAALPLQVRWIDSRDEIFPASVPSNVVCEHSDPVQAGVAHLVPDSRVLIMSFSHAEDFEVVAACLRRQRLQADLPFVGLIGSQTKWATFAHKLLQRGFTPQELAHVTCPIGLPGIAGKEPAVIAVAVAAQILRSLPAR